MFSLSKAITVALVSAAVFAAPVAELNIEARQVACPDVAVFFARGTTEVPTLGTIVGPRFSAALGRALPGRSVDFSGVSYPANVAGFLAGGDNGGSITMANSVTSIANRCSNTKIVMSGYSQGAQVTHKAANRLSSAVQERVVAVVTFGDPNERTALPGVLQSRRRTFCAFGDLICKGQSIVLAPHLSYGSDTPAAATFVAARV
ncbi:cutinase [Panaeolus papilionaceus]|nr:cutinase [Panaeolus papilionaceus]